ncbi:AMP-binding protein [Nonomuraea sp. NPDC059194]|uniref:AMP-binding protein n=1 Tax=Nonomuraea sp. NPDC059194 TaxID=3346764 RepID=UPI0036A5D87B
MSTEDLLRSRGLRPGDRVVVCLPRGADLSAAVDGAIAVGAIVTVLPAGLDVDEHIRASAARIMISDSAAAIEAAEDSRIRQVIGSAELQSL